MVRLRRIADALEAALVAIKRAADEVQYYYSHKDYNDAMRGR